MRTGTLVIALLCTGLLSACATPKTMLRNPQTAQVVTCGGDRSGALMGGMIGYSMQAGDAADCVKAYAAQGFVIVNDGVKSNDANSPTRN